MAIELSVTKDMAEKLNLNIKKTENIEEDVMHWYAKILVFNRKRYAFAINTKTRFAVLFRLQRNTFPADFKESIVKEFNKYGLASSNIIEQNVVLSLGNNKRYTAQLNSCAMDLKYCAEHQEWRSHQGDVSELFGKFNKHNLGKAGNSKEMAFALDEMKKYFG